MYCGDRPVELLVEHVAGLPRRDELLADGTLAVLPTDQVYDVRRPIDPVHQLAVYEAVMAETLAQGFTGLRVVADGTPIAVRPALVAPMRRWEHVADRWIAGGVPLSAMCVFDRRVVPRETLAEVVCVHRLEDPEDAPFHVVGGSDGALLAGEVDAFATPLLAGALADLGPEVTTVDAGEVAFLDHHALAALVAHGRRVGGLTIRRAPAIVRRLWDVAELPGGDAIRFA
jgi:hypothetical protein